MDLTHNNYDHPMESPDTEIYVQREREPQVPRSQALREALVVLKNAKITPTDFLLCVLDESDMSYVQRNRECLASSRLSIQESQCRCVSPKLP